MFFGREYILGKIRRPLAVAFLGEKQIFKHLQEI